MLGAVWVALGGAVGSVARHGLSVWLRTPGRSASPRGTALANLLGAFLAGVLAGAMGDAPADAQVRLLVGVGFLGGLTTFSTWMLEVLDLSDRKGPRTPLFHLVGLLAAGVLCALVGLRLTA